MIVSTLGQHNDHLQLNRVFCNNCSLSQQLQRQTTYTLTATSLYRPVGSLPACVVRQPETWTTTLAKEASLLLSPSMH